MKTQVGFVYKHGREYFTPAQNGSFYVVDMWKCDKNGFVADIEENPCPVPVCTTELKKVGKSKFDYSYPEFDPRF